MGLPESIRTMDDAEGFFRAFGGQGFHMGREHPELYEQYLALGVTRERERLWRMSLIDDEMSALMSPRAGASELREGFAMMTSHLEHQKDARTLELYRRAVREVGARQSDALSLVIAAEDILGRGYLEYRQGPAFIASDLGAREAARELVDAARAFARSARKADAERAEKALKRAEDVAAMEGL